MSAPHDETAALVALRNAWDALRVAEQACELAEFGRVHVLGPLDRVRSEVAAIIAAVVDGQPPAAPAASQQAAGTWDADLAKLIDQHARQLPAGVPAPALCASCMGRGFYGNGGRCPECGGSGRARAEAPRG